MATITGRVAEAKQELRITAGKRWAEREAKREAGLREIAKRGIGAADSAKRQAEWGVREAAKASLGARRFDERMIGATWDAVQFAPSVQASKAATPVARIVTMPSALHEPQGMATGFLIGQGLMLTNYHVFQVRTDAIGYGANFHYVKDERGVSKGKYFELDPGRFFVSDAALDFAIVAVKEKSIEGELLSELGSVRLIEATGKILTGLPVNIIQHPMGRPREFAISDNKLVDILDSGFLHYEADTDRGSSGSPLFNSDWELIGLHHSGVPKMRDGRILKRDDSFWDEAHDEDDAIWWVANEGARVSFIIERLRAIGTEGAADPILSALLASTTDPIKSQSANESIAITSGIPMSGSTFNFSGPVTFHHYAERGTAQVLPAVVPNGGAAPAAAIPSSVAMVQVEKALVFDPAYAERPGFDRHFLGAGATIELPTLDHARHGGKFYSVKDYKEFYEEYRDVPELDVSTLQDTDPLELKYHHYSLVMHKDFKMCIWTASNYDYTAATRQDPRPRKQFGDETWKEDPRVPPWHQLLNNDIYLPAKRVDRGHIVRREDSSWGEPGLDTEYANSDTYHWPNCTPQHEAFNQERPSDRSGKKIYADGAIGIWGRFESELAKQVQAGGGQAVLFAGPVLQDFISAGGIGAPGVKIPRKFWKVVVFRESRKKTAPLLAYGFVFDQSKAVKDYGLDYKVEGLELPEFDRQRKSLAEIQVLAGVSFPQNVQDADQFGA